VNGSPFQGLRYFATQSVVVFVLGIIIGRDLPLLGYLVGWCSGGLMVLAVMWAALGEKS
jgi:hypothetical protein